MKGQSEVKRKVLLLALAAVVAMVAVTVVVVGLQRESTNQIDSFQACKDAGGRIAESYPEQCFIGDKSFVNDTQRVESGEPGNDDDGYIGLTEQAARDRAAGQNKPNRVVERDGESLPVTMDYVPGRLNFHVQDGVVERVVVEGED